MKEIKRKMPQACSLVNEIRNYPKEGERRLAPMLASYPSSPKFSILIHTHQKYIIHPAWQCSSRSSAWIVGARQTAASYPGEH